MAKSNNNYVPMLDFYGEKLYIDVEELDKFLVLKSSDENNITITENFDSEGGLISKTVITDKIEKSKQYDSVKYDLIRYFFDSLSIDMEDTDESLGLNKMSDKMPLSTKLAYNTLAGYGILKKY